MRTRILLLVAAMLFTISSGFAQLPFVILEPVGGSALIMGAELGASDTARIVVGRLIPSQVALRVSHSTDLFVTSDTVLLSNSVNDTIGFDIVFTPDMAGRFYDTVSISDGAYTAFVVIIGDCRGGSRWVLRPQIIDFGVTIIDETSPARTVTLYNNSNTSIALSWDAAKAPFSITGQGVTTSGSTQTVSIAARSNLSLSVNVDATGATPGIVMDTILMGDGAPFDETESLTQQLVLSANFAPKTEPAVVVFTPDVLEFDVTQGQEPLTIKRTVLRNRGPMSVTIDGVYIAGADASAFQITAGIPALPVIVDPGDSMEVSVAFDHSLQGQFDAEIRAFGMTNALLTDTVFATCLLRSTDTTRASITRVRMSTNNANVGEIARATFTNETAVASEAAYAIISLRYNATVLVPETPTMDANDPIVDGYRTSRFKVMVGAHDAGAVLGAVEFRVALGNSSNTTLDVIGFDWYDDLDSKLDVGTSVNGTVVSVLDAQGNEVNVDAGPLSMSVSPMPVSGNATVTYERGEIPVQIKLFDALGNVVADLSANAASQQGTFRISSQGLPAGIYYLRMSGGRHVYVLHVIME